MLKEQFSRDIIKNSSIHVPHALIQLFFSRTVGGGLWDYCECQGRYGSSSPIFGNFLPDLPPTPFLNPLILELLKCLKRNQSYQLTREKLSM